MKTIKFLFASAIIASLTFSCKNTEEKKGDETGATDTTAVSYTAVLDSSSVNWKGDMIKMYSHNGNVKLTEGTFTVKGGTVTAGSFTVDLKSINPVDSAYSAEHKKEDLIKHLATADFFAVDSFPTATFVLKSVEGNTATGDLTVRGKTNEEKVTDIVVATSETGATVTGKLVFNRQKYGVAYKATMKDMVLSDDIALDITLVGKK